jgi:HD superfamily phosphodiesterase
MNPSFTALQKAAELKACSIIETKIKDIYQFHNLDHTRQVVSACEEMAGYYQLNDDDQLALAVAAWFHDTGYSLGETNHENAGIAIAKEFLEQQHTDAQLIDKVSSCIAATQMPQQPANLLEEIICDADLYHLGTDMVAEAGKALRREKNLTKDVKINKTEWAKTNIYFMEKHQYFTVYCREKLEPVKQEYIRRLRKKYKLGNEAIRLPEKITAYVEHHTQQPIDANKKTTDVKGNTPELSAKKEKAPRMVRGVETMFRITSSNNFRLSSMADSKAHIMISVNSIIISIVGSRLLEKLKGFPHYIIPTIILTITCLVAIIFSVLATRPNVSKGKFSREDIAAKKTNLLFFGNFFQMDLEEYEWAMKEMMKDSDYLYGSMVRDIYFLGVVLARKYKLLRIAYNVFMYGLVLSTIAFIIASFFAPSE